ncbi:sensor histidine kinase [Clostridium chrysemydis]|uniref:sensor histidine kinase n=1 Tax=Clostridium chrysemydis TaxID=2665504 RepID=UPI003F3FBED5
MLYGACKQGIHYLMIPEIMISACGTAIGIIAFSRKEIGISTNTAIGFFILSMLGYIRGVMLSIDPFAYNTDFYRALVGCNSILEVSIIPLACIFYKFKLSRGKVFIIYGVLELGILLAFLVNNSKAFININFLSLNSLWMLKIHLISIFSVLILLNAAKTYKKRVNIIPSALIYLTLINIYTALNGVTLIDNINMNFILSLLRDLAYFVLYEAISRRLLEENYISEEEELKRLTKMYEKMNMQLDKRNTILKELQTLNKRSEQRYFDILNSLNDGIMLIHLDNILFINNSASRILEDRLKDSDTKLFINYLIENRDKEKNILKSFDNNREFEVYQIKSGVNDWIVYLKDITDLNKYYEAKKQYDECIKKEKIKNEFYSNVSHELRTPINVIHSALQLNKYYLDNNMVNKIEKNTFKIRQNCLRLIRTINNFIDSNKISEGYLIPNKKNCNIVEVIENVSQVCNKYIQKISNNLIFDTTHEEILVPIDKDMIERVILNLLSNSVKYGEKNKEIYINVSLNEEKNIVAITVQNNSEIISKDIVPYIFDEFTKANKELSREKEGSGLGLYLCKAIIEAHGGYMNFISNKNNNTFMFNIPIKEIENYELQKDLELNLLEEKVDLEFSDIYI